MMNKIRFEVFLNSVCKYASFQINAFFFSLSTLFSLSQSYLFSLGGFYSRSLACSYFLLLLFFTPFGGLFLLNIFVSFHYIKEVHGSLFLLNTFVSFHYFDEKFLSCSTLLFFIVLKKISNGNILTKSNNESYKWTQTQDEVENVHKRNLTAKNNIYHICYDILAQHQSIPSSRRKKANEHRYCRTFSSPIMS